MGEILLTRLALLLLLYYLAQLRVRLKRRVGYLLIITFRLHFSRYNCEVIYIYFTIYILLLIISQVNNRILQVQSFSPPQEEYPVVSSPRLD